MIVILKPNPDPVQAENLIEWIKGFGLDIHTSQGSTHTILGLVGDTTVIDIDLIRAMDIVEDVRRVQEPYKFANRKMHPQDTVVELENGLLPVLGKTKETGTEINFLPDGEIFEKTRFKAEWLKSRLHETAYLNPRLMIHYANRRAGE